MRSGWSLRRDKRYLKVSFRRRRPRADVVRVVLRVPGLAKARLEAGREDLVAAGRVVSLSARVHTGRAIAPTTSRHNSQRIPRRSEIK